MASTPTSITWDGTPSMAFLALHRGEVFQEEEFADLYCSDNGRPSVPPSLLATALLLQAYDGVSDEEAKARADFDLRWKVALGVGLEERPFAKSTLQLFRARLIIHERVRTVFQQSLAFARRTGYFRSRKLKVVLDTTYVLGRGAVKDTYNLLADGISQLARALAAGSADPEEWAREHGLARYFGSSSRGRRRSTGTTPRRGKRSWKAWSPTPIACWAARAALENFPQTIPARAPARGGGPVGAAALQDIERREDGARLKQGVSRIGWCRCMTPRCATVARARGGASTGTRRSSRSIPRAS